MGYSCSAVDSLVLEALIFSLQEANGDAGGSSNSWGQDPANSWFYQIGRENRDGSITGEVLKPLGSGRCIRAGSFKIAGGKIVRWPGSTKAQRSAAEAAGLAQHANRYGSFLR